MAKVVETGAKRKAAKKKSAKRAAKQQAPFVEYMVYHDGSTGLPTFDIVDDRPPRVLCASIEFGEERLQAWSAKLPAEPTERDLEAAAWSFLEALLDQAHREAKAKCRQLARRPQPGKAKRRPL